MRNADEILDDQLTKQSVVGAEIRLWCAGFAVLAE